MFLALTLFECCGVGASEEGSGGEGQNDEETFSGPGRGGKERQR